MKTNYKRVIKTINKLGNKKFFIQYVKNTVFVSQGHFIIAIPVSDFEEYKSELKGSIEEIDLLKIFYDNMDGTEVDMTMTTVQIDFDWNTKSARVFKNKDIIMAVNEQFVDMIRDTIYQDRLATECKARSRKSPLFYADKIYNIETCKWEVIGGFALLPINMDVRDVLNNVLGN